MADPLFLATLVAFFALMVAFVRLCERIVGQDEAVDTYPVTEADADRTAATDPEEVPA